jgi:hypothetical protein
MLDVQRLKVNEFELKKKEIFLPKFFVVNIGLSLDVGEDNVECSFDDIK